MKRGAEVAAKKKGKINDCMQAACNQSVSVCIGVRSLVKSSLDLRPFFFFCCVPLPQYGDKHAYYSEYASDSIYSVLWVLQAEITDISSLLQVTTVRFQRRTY